MGCTIRVAKTKTLISFAVTAKLICVFVFAYAKSRFSHNEAQNIRPLIIQTVSFNILLILTFKKVIFRNFRLYTKKFVTIHMVTHVRFNKQIWLPER